MKLAWLSETDLTAGFFVGSCWPQEWTAVFIVGSFVGLSLGSQSRVPQAQGVAILDSWADYTNIRASGFLFLAASAMMNTVVRSGKWSELRRMPSLKLGQKAQSVTFWQLFDIFIGIVF